MKTAKEYLNEVVYIASGDKLSDSEYDALLQSQDNEAVLFRAFISQLNLARKEAIEECAERAKSEWIRYGTNMGHAVDKQSILSLINELK